MDDDDGTRGEHRRGYEQQPGKKVSWLYYLSVVLGVFFNFFCYVLPHAGYGGGTTDEEDGGGRRRRDNITEEGTLAILPTCLLLLVFSGGGGGNLFVVSHMLAMAEGQRRGE